MIPRLASPRLASPRLASPRFVSDLSLRAGPRQRPPRKYVSHDTRFPITPGHKSTLLSSLGIHVDP